MTVRAIRISIHAMGGEGTVCSPAGWSIYYDPACEMVECRNGLTWATSPQPT